jgi:hypothetical protein
MAAVQEREDVAMPDFPTFPLAGDELRSYLINSTPLDMWQKHSGRSILKGLREQGAKIRTTDFFACRRARLGLVVHQEQIARANPDQLMPRSYMTNRPDIDMTAAAQYRFDMVLYNFRTEEVTHLSGAFADDKHYTPQEARNFYAGLMEHASPDTDYMVLNMEMTSVWINPAKRLTR